MPSPLAASARFCEADAYVKWFRSDEYYSRPIKGSWKTEGGGALINQAIHQVDVLLHLIGPVTEVSGMWQLGARHKIESEDVISAQFRYQSGAMGVIQAATAFWPGYTERIEIHGTKGSAIVSGDKLTSWDIIDDEKANIADPAPIAQAVASGSSDPMAISVTTFERQFTDFRRSHPHRNANRFPMPKTAIGRWILCWGSINRAAKAKGFSCAPLTASVDELCKSTSPHGGVPKTPIAKADSRNLRHRCGDGHRFAFAWRPR